MFGMLFSTESTSVFTLSGRINIFYTNQSNAHVLGLFEEKLWFTDSIFLTV